MSYRLIPPVNAISRRITDKLGHHIASDLALKEARGVQEAIRMELERGGARAPDELLERRIAELESLLAVPKLSPVINATGIVVHTNLGRAPASSNTAEAMRTAASSTVALEVEASSGLRGGRMREISSLLSLITGAGRSLVVNNNAAAVLLALASLGAGKQVAVSRAEAVEIGGGFRIPDVLAQSGATLVEVGTTNRTYADDYAEAARNGAAIFLRIHPSNFSIAGFVATPSLSELREVADQTGALLVEDLGSGTLVSTEQYGIDHEPTVQESLNAGVDVVMFSGDKLLGGPQAGIVCGRQELVNRIASHPLARAVRADKATLAGIAETLRHYVRGDIEQKVPVWMMISASRESLELRADRIVARVHADTRPISIVPTVNYVGGGALPGQALLGCAIQVATASSGAATLLATALRRAAPTAVFARIENNSVLIELRTVLPQDDDRLVEAIGSTLTSLAS